MKNLGNTIIGVVAGTALGAAMGILFAPDKGSKTRKMISKEAETTKNKISDHATELADTIAKKVNVKKATLEEKLEDIATDASLKSNDVIDALEKKLEVLKAKHRHFEKEVNTNGSKKTTATV
ncbi:YtxH domain-containing protein [Formosa sediminum]|uniref:YtxH domain-containing protein n=1 Tax=Formosa sediminum TaxID=2594004 RepID=A0A516GQ03_9FLAO|nr:YtxH domain-containing protein [Formosa sediminum]QDO93563.1 YtxH domain-containing protein [Formosa sediminum]